MINITVPEVVETYFHLMDRDDKQPVADLFTPDAQVADDGAIYRGSAAIRTWLAGAASEFTTTSTRLSADRTERTVVVVVRVEGDFPGGRVDLQTSFELDGIGRITSLIITARPSS